MQAYSGLTDQPGLADAFAAAGIQLYWQNNTLFVSDLAAAQTIVSAYNPLSYVQQQAVAQVNVILAEKIAAGFAYNGVIVPLGTESRANITGKVMQASLSQSSTSSVSWRSFSLPGLNGTGPLTISTATDMISLGNAVDSYFTDISEYAISLEQQIMAATSTSAVQTILTNASWPTS